MSTLALNEQELPISNDDFSALEQRVLQTVELLKNEREARAAAEKRAEDLHQSLENQTAELLRVEADLQALTKDRDHVRQRIERLLKQLDELSA
jgi:septal ring factor EnvC (AmiA/AmiB activator)